MARIASREVEAAKKDARISRNAALIGAAAVLISALLSIVAGVVGANIAGTRAAETTTQQLTGETERSRSEFLRAQRQILYARVLSNELAYAEAEPDLFQGALESDDAYVAASENLSTLEKKLRQDGFELDVIGSDGAVNRFQALTAAHQSVWSEAGKLSEIATDSDADTSAQEEKVAKALNAVGTAQVALRNAFRQDMGAR